MCNPNLWNPTSKMLFVTLVSEGKLLVNDTKSPILDDATVPIFEITKTKSQVYVNWN